MTTLELDDDQALVFYEWLSRLEAEDALPCADRAEELVRWALHGQLETQLVVQFQPQYLELVESARARLRERYGEPAP